MSSGGDLNRRAWHWNKLCPVFFFVRPLIEDKIIRKIFEVSRGFRDLASSEPSACSPAHPLVSVFADGRELDPSKAQLGVPRAGLSRKKLRGMVEAAVFRLDND